MVSYINNLLIYKLKEKIIMLLQFNFKNFKSFKNETTLDMKATNIQEHKYNLVKQGKDNYLKTAAIYGANASR